MAPNRLGRFQQEVLSGFFRREKRFFLTGGAALAGFHLGHRAIEILANKLCTLVSRAEPRDLVDVRALEEAGFRVEEALPGASRKNGGLTPAQLAWVLSQIRLGEEAPLPGGGSASELKKYLADLIARVSRLAFPRG